MRIGLLAFLLCLSWGVHAANITGLWLTVDEEGVSKSIVEIYQQNEKYFGKIVSLLLEPEDTTVCSRCPGEEKDQLVKGMVIIKNLQENKGRYEGGTVLDPTKGKEYRTRIWAEGDTLQVRGYLGMFFRTQAWYRYSEGDLTSLAN